jgi:hypothetical protein
VTVAVGERFEMRVGQPLLSDGYDVTATYGTASASSTDPACCARDFWPTATSSAEWGVPGGGTALARVD